jgi:hypothetical protein
MAEVLHDYGLIRSKNGATYHVRAVGSPMNDTMWQGWLEFESAHGDVTLRSGRETTQPNRTDLVYWATGLTTVFLEGSLDRTLNPLVRPVAAPVKPPAFDGPAPASTTGPPTADAILNPFSVYRKGEQLLRDQLAALSAWHLVNIILAHDMSEMPVEELNVMPPEQLIELIVNGVRVQQPLGTTR